MRTFDYHFHIANLVGVGLRNGFGKHLGAPWGSLPSLSYWSSPPVPSHALSHQYCLGEQLLMGTPPPSNCTTITVIFFEFSNLFTIWHIYLTPLIHMVKTSFFPPYPFSSFNFPAIAPSSFCCQYHFPHGCLDFLAYCFFYSMCPFISLYSSYVMQPPFSSLSSL